MSLKLKLKSIPRSIHIRRYFEPKLPFVKVHFHSTKKIVGGLESVVVNFKGKHKLQETSESNSRFVIILIKNEIRKFSKMYILRTGSNPAEKIIRMYM